MKRIIIAFLVVPCPIIIAFGIRTFTQANRNPTPQFPRFVAKNPDGLCYLKWSLDGKLVQIDAADQGQNLQWGTSFFDAISGKRIDDTKGMERFTASNYELNPNLPGSPEANQGSSLSLCAPNKSCRPLADSKQEDFGLEQFSAIERFWRFNVWQLSSDRKQISILSGHGELVTWNTENGEVMKRTYLSREDGINVAALSPDGKLVATFFNAPNKKIWVFDAETGEKRFSIPSKFLTKIGFSASNAILWTIQQDEFPYTRYSFYDSSNGKFLWRYKYDSIAAPAFLKSDTQVLLPMKQGLKICDSKTGATIRTLTQPKANVDLFELSPDGSTVCSSAHTGEIWSWRLPENS